jgi:hypothetical protein
MIAVTPVRLGFLALFLGIPFGSFAQKEATPAWKHAGFITILTDGQGANIPAGSVVQEFPLLVRLDKDFFDFNQAKPNGRDVRFSDGSGRTLAHQIEEWDAAQGIASISVRVPKILGNERKTLKMSWGRDVPNLSSGARVFSSNNGYLSVWHLGGEVRDEVGTLMSRDTGTTLVEGRIGKARNFPGGKGIFGGDKITGFPTGVGSKHTTQAWIRPLKVNGRAVGWGNEEGQGKVVMWYRSPPHVQMECYFSDANVSGEELTLPMPQWIHAVHTYEKGKSLLYLNGQLANTGNPGVTPLNVERPARFWIGGWYDNYDYVGDIDEVRVSQFARSAEWVRLEYENQRAMQTLTGT